MHPLEYFRRQFLLTINECLDLPWEKIRIQEYNLFYHPDLEFEHVSNGKLDIYILGFLFDYEHPEYSNKQIATELSLTGSFDLFLNQLASYSGHFVVIFKNENEFYIVNDACAQHEVYYDKDFSSFGTQPKLLEKVITLLPHSSYDAREFYSSELFEKSRLFIGETTHKENILHLLPNHFIDVREKGVRRYFPRVPVKPVSLEFAASEAQKMLKGYIKAASFRYKTAIGVTGGYDSRILFLCSLGIDCKYYVTRLPEMTDQHTDLVLSKKLVEDHNRELNLITETNNPEDSGILEASIDFTKNPTRPWQKIKDHLIINGNVSEICRHRFVYYKTVTPEDVSFLYGYSDNKFVITEFGKWLKKNSALFSKLGYRELDMFYWEEKMGKWAAKGKTEMSALGSVVYSPFCSHRLINLLLSTPRQYRDFIDNKLYDRIIYELSPSASKLPVNPSRKKNIIRLLKKLRVFNIYRRIGLKYRLMGTYSW